MITLRIHKENSEYVVKRSSNQNADQYSVHSAESLYESLFHLGRKMHISNIHFNIPHDFKSKLISFLSVEFPAELYDYHIKIID